MQNTYQDIFPLLKTGFFLMPFRVFVVFLFHLFHIGKMFPLQDFIHPGKQTNNARGEIGWIGRVGHGDYAGFWSKTAEHSARYGQVHT